jgi:uncharacterized OB-fold protein/ABC-type spermidine/putrescine transport system permease subunit II
MLPRHRLLLPRCNACGQFWFPPSQRCAHCLAADFTWIEATGRGRVYSFVVFHRVYHPAFEADVPYAVAIVELDEGPRLLANIIGIAADDVRCDMRVQAVFQDMDSVTIPNLPSFMTAAARAFRPQRFSPLVLGLILVLLVIIVPPVLFLIQSSLRETNFDGSFGAVTSRYYRNLIENDRFLLLVFNSALYAFGSALLALTLGGVQAWIVERTDTPLRRSMVVVSIVSLGIPSVLYTISFLLLLGRTGPLNQLLMGLTGSTEPIFNVYSLGGMILVQGIEYTPLCFLLLSAVFRSNDAAFEEASMMSGAGLGTTFRRITFKLVTPAVAALLILIFIRAFEAFETLALVGLPGRVRVLTSDIYQTMLEIPPNYGGRRFSVIS